MRFVQYDQRNEARTSSGRTMGARVSAALLVGWFALCPGTSVAGSLQAIAGSGVRPLTRTASGTEARGRHEAERGKDAASTKLYELRRFTGLTWEQLAQMLGTSRRTLHLWANGGAISPANRERLGRTLAAIKNIDRGNATDNRDLLLRDAGDGGILLDVFSRGESDKAVALAGVGPGRPDRALTPLAAGERARRAPRPPVELLDARHDRLHDSDGKLVSARRITMRKKSPEA